MSLEEKEPSSAATVETQNAVSPRSLHTPGPWHAVMFEPNEREQFNERFLGIVDEAVPEGATGPAVCLIAPISRVDERDKANARLIVTAPELLEACKIALEQYKQDIAEIGPCDHAVNVCICGLVSDAHAIKAAIAKAEGASSVPDGSKSDNASYSK